MGRQITINSITATEGYNVFTCDTTLITCIYLATINNSDLPYTIELPPPFDTLDEYKVKIVDANGCEIIKTF